MRALVSKHVAQAKGPFPMGVGHVAEDEMWYLSETIEDEKASTGFPPRRCAADAKGCVASPETVVPRKAKGKGNEGGGSGGSKKNGKGKMNGEVCSHCQPNVHFEEDCWTLYP